MRSHSRRQFLQLASRTLAGSGLALGAQPWWTLARAAEANQASDGDYRALVCVFLQGGCDGFSLMVPTGQAEYGAYERSRAGLAVPKGSLLPLHGSDGKAPVAGLHPSATAVRPLFDGGRLAMLANVGNLMEPVSKQAYEEGSAILPAQLFSHADQATQWQQLQGRDRASTGWGALAAAQLAEFQERDYLTSITLSGANYWQAGFGQRPFSLKESGVLEYAGLGADDNWTRPRREAFLRVLEHRRSHLMTSAYADMQQRAMQISTELGQTLAAQQGMIDEPVPDYTLARQLAMVARLIGARAQLGMHRQIFYVEMGGFDVHDNQNLEMPKRFAELCDSLAWFQRALDTLGEARNVISFTSSDFGRSLTSNGDGTDHGWGNHLMVMGDAVSGGDIHGTLPLLDIGGPDSVHHGRILPTAAASQYAATLLEWIGLPPGDVDRILPQLGNFPDRTLGFLKA